VTREELESVRDRLFVLSCVLEDVERDLERGDVDQVAAFGLLLGATKELVAAE
jgi:hypothetical protein